MANYSKTQELFNIEPNKVPGLKYEKPGTDFRRKMVCASKES
jgi:hypothetical protein